MPQYLVAIQLAFLPKLTVCEAQRASYLDLPVKTHARTWDTLTSVSLPLP
jgi:hypothetical protein